MAGILGSIAASMRPQHWIKNFFLFAALIFAGRLFNSSDFLTTTLAFLCFSLSASAVYIFNDIVDKDKDRLHPVKSKRPLPSGRLSVGAAQAACGVLVTAGIGGAWFLGQGFLGITAGYVLLNVLYSVWLKEIVILDVMTVAAGFVLRVAGGAIVLSVPMSEWLIICTLLLSLFLGFAKRRHELTVLEGAADEHRAVLQHYSPYFLDQMIGIVTACTVMSYALYTIAPETVAKFHTRSLIYTVPFVVYGIFRYLYLIHRKKEGGDPVRIALTDKPLIVTLALWIGAATTIIYSGSRL